MSSPGTRSVHRTLDFKRHHCAGDQVGSTRPVAVELSAGVDSGGVGEAAGLGLPSIQKRARASFSLQPQPVGHLLLPMQHASAMQNCRGLAAVLRIAGLPDAMIRD